MTVAAVRQFLSVGEIAVRLGILEGRVRRFLSEPREYLILIGRTRAVAEADLDRLASDLRKAGLLADNETTKETL